MWQLVVHLLRYVNIVKAIIIIIIIIIIIKTVTGLYNSTGMNN